MSPMPMLGRSAPDFTLPGTDGTDEGRRDYALADYRGGPVLLVFYPGDDTVVCTKQLNAYTREIDGFRKVGVELLAISPQSVASHDAFHEKQGGFAFPLLADAGKAVGQQYGVLGPIGFYRRSVFLVDGVGKVRYRHRAVAGLSFRPSRDLINKVEQLSS